MNYSSIISFFNKAIGVLFSLLIVSSCNHEHRYVFSVDEYGAFVDNSEVVFQNDAPVDAYLLLGTGVDYRKINMINSEFSEVFTTQDLDVNSLFKIAFLPMKIEAENVYSGFRDSNQKNMNVFYQKKIILNQRECFIMTVVDKEKNVIAYSMFSLESDSSEYKKCIVRYVNFFLSKR